MKKTLKYLANRKWAVGNKKKGNNVFTAFIFKFLHKCFLLLSTCYSLLPKNISFNRVPKFSINKLANNSGYSLVELMIGLAVFGVVMVGISETYVLFQRYWTDSNKKYSYQSAGRSTLENMGRSIRRAQNVTIVDSATETQAQIRDVTGTNLLYSYDKNNFTIEFDDDTSTPNDEVAVLFNVMPIGAQLVFQAQGSRMIDINFRVLDPDTTDGTHGRDFALSAYWRN